MDIVTAIHSKPLSPLGKQAIAILEVLSGERLNDDALEWVMANARDLAREAARYRQAKAPIPWGDAATQCLALAAGRAPELASRLLSIGANPDGPHANGTPLAAAALVGNREVMRRLIHAGADPNANKGVALLRAAQGDFHAGIWLLVEAGADVAIDDSLALRVAARYGHLRIVKLLVQSGADAKASGCEPLRAAACNANTEVVEWLLQKCGYTAEELLDAIKHSAPSSRKVLLPYYRKKAPHSVAV